MAKWLTVEEKDYLGLEGTVEVGEEGVFPG